MSKPGSAKPVVTMTLARCGTSAPLLVLVMSVSGSVEPSSAFAFDRFTVPVTGLVTRNSDCGPYGSDAVGAVLTSLGFAMPCCTARSIARTTFGTGTPAAAAASISALLTSKYWPPLLAAMACSSATAEAAGASAMT